MVSSRFILILFLLYFAKTYLVLSELPASTTYAHSCMRNFSEIDIIYTSSSDAVSLHLEVFFRLHPGKWIK